MKTPLTSLNTLFEIDRVIIIPHNVTFSDNGCKPLVFRNFVATRGPNWPTWPKSKSILNTHPISVPTKFELDCVNTFSDNGWKPPFSVILWPLEGQNLANMAQKRINSEHSPNKGTYQV